MTNINKTKTKINKQYLLTKQKQIPKKKKKKKVLTGGDLFDDSDLELRPEFVEKILNMDLTKNTKFKNIEEFKELILK